MAFVIAHRGDATHCLENSLNAFQAAINLGLSHIELDIQLSVDGYPIVIHDESLLRTHGISLNVTTTTYRNLQELGLFAYEFLPEPLLLLSTFSEWLNRNPQVVAFVELKRESIRRHGRISFLNAIDAILASQKHRIVLISYDLKILELAQFQGWETGYVVRHMEPRDYAEITKLNPLWLFANYRELLHHETFWMGPWHWASFEISNLSVAKLLTDLGVEGLETMDPALLLSAGYDFTPIFKSEE